MPSARCSMLDRAEPAAPASQGAGNGDVRPVAFRGGGFAPRAGRHAGWIALVLMIGLWQLAGSSGWINPLFLPPPSAIARAIYQLAISGALWRHLSYSIMRIGTGWILGTVAGVVVGFAIGLSSLARGVGVTFISALFPIPKIALLPLLILWLGIGEQPKIATIALGVFFFPAVSVSFGVGAFVLQAGNLMQTDQLLAGVVILSLFGLAVGRLINFLETRLLHWR